MIRAHLASTALILAAVGLAGPAEALAQAPVRAKPGEKMMAVINIIKADKKEQFEDYVRKFDAAAAQVSAQDPTIKRMVTQTRLLKPTKSNGDGTFTYIWLMDPLVEEVKYDMTVVLKRAMPEAEADALIQQYFDSIFPERHQVLELVQGER